MTATYTTRQDAIQAEIIPALGDHATDYDTDGIADELLTWHAAIDEQGTEHVQQSGFQVKPQYSDDPDAFWSLAAKHDRTAS